MNGWFAFRKGLSLSLRYKWVLLILFVVNLLSASLLALLPSLWLLGPAHRPAIRQAADGLDAWLVFETMMSSVVNTALPENGGAGSSSGIWVLLLLAPVMILPLLAWLPASFLSGGAVLTFAEALQPFRWRRFWWGCWHWFAPFLLLGIIQAAVFVIVLIPTIIIAAIIIPVAQWSTWILIPVLILLILLWLLLVEYVRVAAVVSKTRNIFRAFGQAISFIFRNPLAVAGLYGLALLLLLLLHVIYHWALRPYLPLSWWLLVLLVQQTFIITRLWVRLARLAGATVLLQEKALK
jgi:hypothetical protein